MMFSIRETSRMIHRDYNRTERDDFLLNVQPILTDTTETVPVYANGAIVGWKIQFRYE